MSFWTKPKKSRSDELAIISCLFSPKPHERRRKNFAEFSKQFGANLYVAELAYDESPWVTEAGPAMFHFRGEPNHILWQKERLFNTLVSRLPSSITAVAWVDADILFVDSQWQSRALAQLREFPVIQLFDTVVHLDADGFPASQATGLISAARGDGPAAFAERKGAAGFAWAARRELLGKVGLLDFMVLGGADTYMACGFAGVRPDTIFSQLPRALRASVEVWCDAAYAATAGKVGNLAGTIEHLFHGNLGTRGYLQRYSLLRRAAFDPAGDIAIGMDGLYAWNTSKLELRREVAGYFEARAQAENA